MKNKLLLVDGMALLFRGFFATSFRGNFMKTETGLPTNGVYQFLKYFLHAESTFRPTHIICCWDMGKDTFRTSIYEGYKTNREHPPEELVPQFDLVKKVVELFRIPNVGVANYEADDCIGTLTANFKTEAEITVLTGDRDLLQLVDCNVQVAIMKKGIGNYDLYSMENFHEKTGIDPQQVIEVKALMGDSSDNYPGVKGIGEKTAMKLIKEYGSVDSLLRHLSELPKGIQTKITNDREMLRISRELAEIKKDVPLEFSMEEAAWNRKKEDVVKKLNEMELNHFAKLIMTTA
ncbi:5'-3' exonuclease [Compostibacillus humi]|nr:5'-3' exonuclease [Compostibacillus humi]